MSLSYGFEFQTPENLKDVHCSIEKGFHKKEVLYYSQINATQISFDKSQLEPYRLPLAKTLNNGDWNTRNGYKLFQAKKFGENESRIRNLLLITIKYELTKYGTKYIRPKVLCHSGLFCDVINNSKETYDVICYDGQLIFSSTNRRLDQNLLISYIGIRFEDLLKYNDVTQKTRDNFKHFKTLGEGYIGDKEQGDVISFLSVTEIDSLKGTKDKEPGKYTEIKLTISHGMNWKKLQTSDNTAFLATMSRAVSGFERKLLKWILQCKFGMSKHLLVGLRDGSFNVRAVHLFSLEKDLIPFLKRHYRREYSIYVSAIDKLQQFFAWIEQSIEKNKDCTVYRLEINGYSCKLSPLVSPEESEQVFNNVMIKPFIQWRETKKDSLVDCKDVVEPAVEPAVDNLSQALEATHIR
ncbi:hypothetical protein FOA43_001890 [Brettanomyces nanus]|uniref:Decapping nuclease n=1 Tax=Eeniella nana TaxID=13502 RepID=A0A875S456_EENNA|nr:uncharacterized protein FOA43_001890 [Brettanomyces nanus]QPG74559.1 hypothetical protein FOA43_001890 [Brettanomyces nanus]